MNTRVAVLAVALSFAYSCAATAGQFAGAINNLDPSGLALQGYDPVAYFVEGGSAPKLGKQTLQSSWNGVLYYFADEFNRDAFLANPSRYEPRYGGWCAWAMMEGDLVEIDPESFLVEQDSLYLFYDSWIADTRKLWLAKGGLAARKVADAEWAVRSAPSPAEID